MHIGLKSMARILRDKPRTDESGQKINNWTLLSVVGVKRIKNKINDRPHRLAWIEWTRLWDIRRTI